MDGSKSFYSKILLFGEYSVIKDSWALAIPYPLFEGRLIFKRSNGRSIDLELRDFSKYLRKLFPTDKHLKAGDKELNFTFDVTSYEFDISQGLYFDSTIPRGFGLGSSGALCAALFDRYGKIDSKTSYNIFELKKVFAALESHFHGSSSGIDPLISFLNTPILIREKNELGPVEIPLYKEGEGAIFLLNTGRTRRTEPLVDLFLEKCNTEAFKRLCDDTLLPITNNCIISFLEGDKNALYKSYRLLSDFQYKYLAPMIPKLFYDIWEEGIKSQEYYLKLCGAGGGGFLLGMTQNFERTRKILNEHEVRRLFQL